MGGGGGKQTTNTVAEPPKFLQPYLQDAAQRSFDLFGQGGREYFPNSTVVPFAPQTQQALSLTQQRALQGGAATNAAQGYAQQGISGNFLDSNPFANGSEKNPFQTENNPFIDGGSNPFLDRTFNRAADSVQQRLQSGFAGSGRDIEAARPVAAQEMNDLATGIYGGAYESDANRRQAAYDATKTRTQAAYEATQGRRFDAFANERKAQDYAASIAPMLDSTDYQDLDALRGVGAQREDLFGRQLQDQIDRFDYAQNLPYQNLDEYIARIQGAFPGQSQSTSSRGPGPNRLAGALGGGLTGAATGAKIGATGGPIGAGTGALIGALGGYFLS